jgi:hypothetical protein
MKRTVLDEINNMKYLFSYNRSKTLNEQQETLVPTPTPVANSQPVPTPTPNNQPVPTPTPVPNQNLPELPPAETPETPTAMSSSRIEQGKPNDPYQYKFEDDGNTQKYYYAKKGSNNWKQSVTPKSVEAIKKNVFGIN